MAGYSWSTPVVDMGDWREANGPEGLARNEDAIRWEPTGWRAAACPPA
jgi:hypothetical protein